MAEEGARDGGRQPPDHIRLGTTSELLALSGYVRGSQQKVPEFERNTYFLTHKHICACIDRHSICRDITFSINVLSTYISTHRIA